MAPICGSSITFEDSIFTLPEVLVTLPTLIPEKWSAMSTAAFVVILLDPVDSPSGWESLIKSVIACPDCLVLSASALVCATPETGLSTKIAEAIS